MRERERRERGRERESGSEREREREREWCAHWVVEGDAFSQKLWDDHVSPPGGGVTGPTQEH